MSTSNISSYLYFADIPPINKLCCLNINCTNQYADNLEFVMCKCRYFIYIFIH